MLTDIATLAHDNQLKTLKGPWAMVSSGVPREAYESL